MKDCIGAELLSGAVAQFKLGAALQVYDTEQRGFVYRVVILLFLLSLNSASSTGYTFYSLSFATAKTPRGPDLLTRSGSVTYFV